MSAKWFFGLLGLGVYGGTMWTLNHYYPDMPDGRFLGFALLSVASNTIGFMEGKSA